MYKRHITVDPSHPEASLQSFSIGLRSTGILVIDGIPQAARNVRILAVKPGYPGYAFQFDGRKVGSSWEITFPQDEFIQVGEGTYELFFDVRTTYWSSRGKYTVIKAYDGSIVPPSPYPDEPHTIVVSVNSLRPDKNGNVDITPILKPIFEALATIRQVPDLSDLGELMPDDSDRATKNLLNAILRRLKGA